MLPHGILDFARTTLFSVFLRYMHTSRFSSIFRAQLFALIICSGCSVFLSAQNKDSLYSVYRQAARSHNKDGINKSASALGLLYMNAGQDDSAVFFYNVALNNASTRLEKANAYTGMARSTLFTKPLYSMNTAKKGLPFVMDTVCEAKVNLSNAIGIYYSLNGKYDSALYYYTIALSAAKKMEDEKLIVKVKSNLGDLYSYQGLYGIALKYQLETLSYFERTQDSSRILPTIVNIGNTYNYMTNDSMALAYYMRVYPFLKNKKTRLAGNLFNSIAAAYEGLAFDLKDTDPLFAVYTEKQESFLLQAMSVKQSMDDSIGLANVLINLGKVEVQKKNNRGAISYFNRSLEIANKLQNTRLERAIYGQLGSVYHDEKQYDKALQIFSDMRASGERDKDLSAQYDALSGIYRAYAGKGDYKNAYKALLDFKEMLKQLNNIQTSEKIADAEAKYKNKEKQRENDKLAFDNQLKTIEKEKAEKDKKMILIISCFGLVLTLFIFYLVNRNVRIQAKAKEQQEVTKAIYESEQKERIRISRDLHDNVGTQLSLISNDIEWITHPLKTLTEAEKAEKLELIGSASKEVINTLRETIWALNKEEVSFEEFADKLKAHVQKQTRLTKNVTPSFSENLESTIMLGPPEALGLFRICQEAIANALKYAQSEKLDIAMSTHHDKYKLIIADHGKGFDKSGVELDKNYGLANMKFRADEIACTVDIVSSPEKGTIVTITKK